MPCKVLWSISGFNSPNNLPNSVGTLMMDNQTMRFEKAIDGGDDDEYSSSSASLGIVIRTVFQIVILLQILPSDRSPTPELDCSLIG